MPTPKDLMNSVFRAERVNRIPFAPAVYEHKAFLIDESPSKVAKDSELLYEALLEEYSTYSPDLLTVGLDVYNIEPEALGCKVNFYSESDNVPVIRDRIVDNREDIFELEVPDPDTAGRMPLMLKAGKRINKKLGDEVYIRGAVSGPFSLACHLGGQQKTIMAAHEGSDFIRDLLELSTTTIKEFAKAWVEAGLGVVVFDSLASPPLISPETYSKLIKPYHEKLFGYLDNFELSHKPLIIGGNTTSIASELADVGADYLLCDYDADKETYLEISEEEGITVRFNLDPDKIKNKAPEDLKNMVLETIEKGKDFTRFVLGTGVLVYDTPKENVLRVREVCREQVGDNFA